MTASRASGSRRSYLATVAATLTLGGCVSGTSASTLRMGVVPDVDPDTAIEQNSALADYLAERLDTDVDLSTSTDYAGMVQSMASEQVDLAYFGGVSYVLAHERAGATPVVVGSEDGSTEWHSVFVSHASTDIEDLAAATDDAERYELVFGDPISTSGTVMPTYYLRTEYDTVPEDFASTTHVGAHDATANAIGNGSGDIGALNARIYDSLASSGRLDGVVEVWRTPGFPDYPWAVAPTVGQRRTDAIREAFTALDDRNETEILDTQNVDEYVPVTHETFTSLHDAVEMAGLLEDTSDG